MDTQEQGNNSYCFFIEELSKRDKQYVLMASTGGQKDLGINRKKASTVHSLYINSMTSIKTWKRL